MNEEKIIDGLKQKETIINQEKIIMKQEKEINKYKNQEYGKLFNGRYISKDKIRNKINELTLKNRIPIKDQYVMYDCIKRNFQIEILEELLNEEGEPDAK